MQSLVLAVKSSGTSQRVFVIADRKADVVDMKQDPGSVGTAIASPQPSTMHRNWTFDNRQ